MSASVEIELDESVLDPPSRVNGGIRRPSGADDSEDDAVAAGITPQRRDSAGEASYDAAASSSPEKRMQGVMMPAAAASAASSSSPSAPASAPVDGPQEESYIRVAAMTGYNFSWKRECIYYCIALLTGGLSCLLAYWFPVRATKWRYRRQDDLLQAEYVLVESMDGASELLPVERVGPHPSAYVPSALGTLWLGPLHLNDPINFPLSYIPSSDRMVYFRHHRFVLDPQAHPPVFVKQREPLQEPAGVLLQRLERGLDTDAHTARQKHFGLNQLTIIVPSYPTLLMRELFHPFFIFQIYSVILWCFEAYYIFALCIFVIAAISIVTTLLETRSRLQNLSNLAKFDVELTVLRNDGPNTPARLQKINSASLVAGDIVLVETGIVPCDMSLLAGGAVVNEAMLTGESLPVIKSPLSFPSDTGKGRDALMSLGIESRSTLYSATRILQLKPSVPGAKVWGIVVRTGFATTKGALILSILYPRPSAFGFITQSYKFIGALFCMALLGFGVSIWQLYEHGAATKTMIIRGLDLITIVVPPSLPLALSVGTNFALLALKAQRIFCISPARINLAGKIQFMCFDKTGTLTSEGMELMGVLPSRAGVFEHFHPTASKTDVPSESPGAVVTIKQAGAGMGHAGDDGGGGGRGWSVLSRSNGSDEVTQRLNRSSTDADSPLNTVAAGAPASSLSAEILTAMSCCHAIASMDGELIGDPLEIEIFNSTHAMLHDAARDGFVCFITCPLPAASRIIDSSLASSSSASSSSSSSLISSDLHAPSLAEFGVITQFEFVPALQRMSVIVANQSQGMQGDVRVFVKGSPEMMRPLCIKDSIPQDYERMLSHYAHRGYRIIAIGVKSVDNGRAGIPKLEKEDLRLWAERDLTFLGLLVLENKVKPETLPTLNALHRALVRSVIVSGDNPLTCISVGKECGIVESGMKLFVSTIITDEYGRKRIEWIDTDEDGGESSETGGAHMVAAPLKLNPRTLRLDAASAASLNGRACKYELALTGSAFKLLEDAHFDAVVREGGPAAKERTDTDRIYLKNDLGPMGSAHDEEFAAEESATRFFHRVILSTLVFARMTPDDKAALVGHLQSLGLYTGMCGDGANDCGALKTAHVGVSLSESEASIAAPFTYQRPNISCIPTLLSEGRSSLMTSFQLFKYMVSQGGMGTVTASGGYVSMLTVALPFLGVFVFQAMYSMIQFTAIIMLYFKGSVFGNWSDLANICRQTRDDACFVSRSLLSVCVSALFSGSIFFKICSSCSR